MFQKLGILASVVSSMVRYYTSGFENVAWVEGYTTGIGSIAKNADHLYAHASDPAASAVRTYVTDIAVDLTNIHTLYIDWENTGAVTSLNRSYFNVSTSKLNTVSIFDLQITKTNPFARTIETIDVTALTGNYYLRVHARDVDTTMARTSEVKVYNVWGV